MERMTTNELENLVIQYSFATSPFGKMLIASTKKGICYMAFYDDEDEKAVGNLQKKFPKATFQHQSEEIHQKALLFFQADWNKIPEIKLHLKGTDFQFQVWEELLKIPLGKLATYSRIADKIANSSASRAVGTAIGSNPIAYLIPCHRVVQTTGGLGGYMWGTQRKKEMINWENDFFD